MLISGVRKLTVPHDMSLAAAVSTSCQFTPTLLSVGCALAVTRDSS